MVRQARDKRVYHRLLIGDITDAVLELCRWTPPPPGFFEWDTPKTKDEVGGAPADKEGLDRGILGSSSNRSGDAFRSSATPDLGSPESDCAMPREGGDGGGDLVISCDVFVYIGDLRACLNAVHNLVTKNVIAGSGGERGGAIFAFSAEAPPHAGRGVERDEKGRSTRHEGGDRDEHLGYELQGTGRYAPGDRWSV